MRYLPLILLLVVTACASPSGLVSSPQTGLNGQYTSQVVISDHPHHVLMGHLITVDRNGTRSHALIIAHRRDGVHRLRMAQAWSNGTELPFTATTLQLDGCTHGHCRDSAIGIVTLSDGLLAMARREGLSARLTGRSDAVDIHVPARLFQSLPD
ncbi:hypothetical protein [Gymnodinialimonas ulvae]|uniref:hypothetical protein n=1 Tax=Gymnodinialimonas ulvae TaxID=3126504 RepID=UPI00309B40F3